MHLFDLKMSALFKDLERVLEDSGLIWNVGDLGKFLRRVDALNRKGEELLEKEKD